MKSPIDTMKKAIAALQERGKTYDTGDNGIEENFTRAADIAGMWLNRDISPRDVAIIMASVKMSRIAVAPGHQDSFVDLINYVSFAAAFSTSPEVSLNSKELSKAVRDGTDAGAAGGVN